MPFENKELSRAWKIVFIDRINRINSAYAVMLRFKVNFPTGKGKAIRPVFTEEFVEDYFHITGTQESDRVVSEREGLFIKWGLIRIEECIDKDSLEEEPKISQADFKWAEKVEKGYLQPSSKQQDNNTYIYIPERKIGFK